jgi:cardiolipin synthase (CMP-forming)
MQARDIPNVITVGRILLVAPTAWALLRHEYPLALLLFCVAGASDALDGWLAKRFDWGSRLGALLDPLADKALLIASYAALTWTGLLPAWLFALVLLRDVVIVAGAAVYHLHIARLDAQPTRISKLNTLFQILLVVAVIVQQATGWGEPQWIVPLLAAVTLTTLWSGIDYVITWSQRARQAE